MIAAAACVCTAALLRSSWERRQLEVVRYRIPVPAGQCPLGARFVFLSDLHDYCRDFGTKELLEKIQQLDPEFILLGGDMLTCDKYGRRPTEPEPSLKFILELARNYSVLYGEGNHESRFRSRDPEAFAEYRRKLEEAGVIYLIDRKVVFEELSFAAPSLDFGFYRRRLPGMSQKEPMPGDYLLKKLGMPSPDHYNIMLLHSPMYFEEAAAWGAGLVLSGHFHGGTIRLPLPGLPGLMTPQFQFFVKECSGLHRRGRASYMVANRGLGTHSINLRLNDLPEISLIELVKDDAGTDLQA